MSKSKSESPGALHNYAGRATALGVFQLSELPTVQAGQCLLPCSSHCSSYLSRGLVFRKAQSHLDCAFDHARQRGNTSGCQMPPTAAPAGGFLSIWGFKMLKLGMTAPEAWCRKLGTVCCHIQ